VAEVEVEVVEVEAFLVLEFPHYYIEDFPN
jgi:hypothetical protein